MNINLNKHTDNQELINSIRSLESKFINLIRQRLGIIVHDNQINELNKTILKACLEFNCSPDTYHNMLVQSDSESSQFEHLILGITIGESYFFRDKKQMQLIFESVLPEIIKRKREQKNLSIRIWSAGCSSGEEIYTIAMQLYELLPDLTSWTINLLGTDINTASLHKATQGIYSEWSMRSISDKYKNKYFNLENKKYNIKKPIRELVTFAYLNLNEDSYPSIFNGTNSQDLILCRNVLIYFDSEKVSYLMRKLGASLIPGGYLLLGASDPVNISQTNLIFDHKKSLLFIRPGEEQIINEIKQPVKELKKSVLRKKESIPVPKKIEIKPTKIQIDKQIIIEKLHAGLWQEALDIIEQCEKSGVKQAFLLSTKATAMANLGKLNEAITYCDQSLKLDPTNKYTYFTLALTFMELNKFKESEELLRKALFLDHQFVEGHFQLGLLLIKTKQNEAGLKSLRNALTISQKINPKTAVIGCKGLDYGRLTEILKNEIELYVSS